MKYLGLLAIALVVFMGKSYETSLQAMDSSIHARLALNATSGDGIAPVLPIRDLEAHPSSKGFNDHPFTLFYLNGWIMRALGPDAFSARLLPSAFAVGCVFLLFWLGTLLYGSSAVGIVAAFVLTTTPEFVGYGARFHLDPAMIFFILLSFVFFVRQQFFAAAIAVGIGIWMKNVVALLLFPSAILYLIFVGELSRKKFAQLLGYSIVAIGVGSIIWILTGLLGNWELVSDYLNRQLLGTAVGGRGGSQAPDYWMWAKILKSRYLPWLLLLLPSLFWVIKEKRWKEKEVALPLAGALVTIVAISMMRFKYNHYFLPMYPFLALLAVDGIRNWCSRQEKRISQFMIGFGTILPAFLLVTPIGLSPESFPALKRFNPIIQSYGDCQSRVLYVDGGQPYGSYGDYKVELSFYTNREVLTSDCAKTNSWIEKETPAWIILSRGSLAQCVSPRNKQDYPVQYQFGNQYLLSRIIPANQATNLTPLGRELRAPLRCEGRGLAESRYFKH